MGKFGEYSPELITDKWNTREKSYSQKSRALSCPRLTPSSFIKFSLGRRGYHRIILQLALISKNSGNVNLRCSRYFTITEVRRGFENKCRSSQLLSMLVRQTIVVKFLQVLKKGHLKKINPMLRRYD